MDMALGSGNTHMVGFNTSTVGLKTGTITVGEHEPGVQTTAATI